jgi:hypothetical protein
MAVDYASMRSSEEIASKYGTKAEHLVESAVEQPPDPRH